MDDAIEGVRVESFGLGLLWLPNLKPTNNRELPRPRIDTNGNNQIYNFLIQAPAMLMLA